jgi:dTDP-glucose 4,6-dehydratase
MLLEVFLMGKRILVTGGCGFITSNFLNKYVLLHPEHHFLNIDCMTYAADPNNILISSCPNYWFSKTDICDKQSLQTIFDLFQPDWVIHTAAESHVGNSLLEPRKTFDTNTIGTLNLLECATKTWKDTKDKIFYYMSTDEVYGETLDGKKFTEETPYAPNTPYSASKACGNHLVRIYNKTYGIPTRVTCCSNNYGPNQHVEKFFPRMMYRMVNKESLTLHKDGNHIRDWLYVEDHCDAVWAVLEHGKDGEVYNVGGNNELTILDTTYKMIKYAAEELKTTESSLIDTIEFIKDRPANDTHYAIDSGKIQRELGWKPQVEIEEGFKRTIQHYIEKFSKKE